VGGRNVDDFAATGKFINRDRSQPWLLVFASHDPHGPWTRGPKRLYDPAKLTVPPYLHDNAVTRKQLAAYYAEITKLDQQVGALMKVLADSGQADDTLVMFVSEQGSSFPYGGKWSVYDNGIRIATLARWPGKIKPGSKSKALVQYVDVPPTFLDAAGADPTKIDTGCPDAEGKRGFDGRSFLKVLLGKADHHRDYVFAQHTTVGINGYREPYPMRAVRDARYKLIRNLAAKNTYWIAGIHKGEPLASWQEDAKKDPELARRMEWLFHRPAEELYDLESDPYEMKNLAGDPPGPRASEEGGRRVRGLSPDRGKHSTLAPVPGMGGNMVADRQALALAPAGVLVLLGITLVASRGPEAKPVGIDKRIPWTTSRVKGSPEPPAPYVARVAFPGLKFFEPLDLAAVPGTRRLAVAQRDGKVFTFPNDPKTKKADLLLDVKKGLYALAFHPRFAENGYVFVTYIAEPDKPAGTHVSRFRVTHRDPPRCDPASEKVIFTWPSGGHNGGCLKFGPDGYLYIATGDGSGIADGRHTGQDLGDVLASILRIDVDHPDAGKAYGIPKDNPFVKTPGARPEVWAYGVRQPWRMNFDRATGDLWAGEVGQDLWEMVLRIEKGGNYGWSVREGRHPFRPERKKGPTPILDPAAEHPHSDFRSITGGYVYHGKRLPGLAGAYLYADFDVGRVWGLRYDGKKVTWQKELTRTALRIVCFGEDTDGEVYFLDFVGGRIHHLAPRPKTAAAPPFPRKLSETGLFASTKDLEPAPGLIPYSVNAPLWSDHAHKERFIALPGNSKIEYEVITYPQPAPGATPGWRFPDGTVLVKTFSLDMEQGNPRSRRRLETRLLHFQQIPGSDEYGEGYW
jgi:glucose/arabinose dehydrogenase